ncbi:DUF1269 domain-containing protein [Bradyrhizobium sp. SYSU BS000235]|uniref:DUF1269 domain-containing protein n=1 Tax=Bradyrhizobium sp. SYSU BS000235 TaxID=3411332 RepID=UPI003C7670DC
MSDLVIVGFDNQNDADRVLTDLTRLQKEYLIDLEDAVVAIRDADGTVRIKQSVNLVRVGATAGGLNGALLGSLIGLLFLNPLAGFAMGGLIGAGSGALSGSLMDFGINDDFIKKIGETIKPDSSALFLLIRKAQPEKVLQELHQYKGHLIRSSLSPEQENKLKEALERAQAPSPSAGVEGATAAARQPDSGGAPATA